MRAKETEILNLLFDGSVFDEGSCFMEGHLFQMNLKSDTLIQRIIPVVQDFFHEGYIAAGENQHQPGLPEDTIHKELQQGQKGLVLLAQVGNLIDDQNHPPATRVGCDTLKRVRK